MSSSAEFKESIVEQLVEGAQNNFLVSSLSFQLTYQAIVTV
jgi:hypothetical protein